MPLITLAYLSVLGGMLCGLSEQISWPLGGVAVAFCFAALARHALTGALAALVAAGTVAGAGARQEDARCITLGARQGEWRAVLAGDARVRGIARGIWNEHGCDVSVTIAVARGAAPAGSLVRVRGDAVAGRRAIIVRNAHVVWQGDGPLLSRWRARVGSRIDRLFGNNAPIARALLIAEQRAIPVEVRDRYADSGLVHILSVSGLHVAILAGAVQMLLAMLPIPRSIALIIGALLTALYVALIGAPPAALRAGSMLAAMALGRVLQRPTSPWALLSAGALVPLADPRIAGDLGYQLSVAGMTAVICAGLLAQRLPHAWPAWRRRLGSDLLTSVLAAAFTGPLVAATFGRLSIISPVSNLIAAPLIALIQPALFLALALSPFDGLARLVADGSRPPLALLDAVATITASMPFAALPVSPRSVVCWFLVLSAIAVAAACASRHGARMSAAALALVAAAAWWPQRGSGESELHVLDVGQGDALAVRSARGRWVLIDAGPAWQRGDAGRSTVVPYLRRRGGVVAALILSHPHTDHVGGSASVVRALRPASLWEPAFTGMAASYRAALTSADERQVSWRQAVAGANFSVDELNFEIIGPDSAWLEETHDPNDASAVVMIRAGSVRFLLTGDAEAAAERRLVERGAPLRADVLKAGHHGSATSSTPELLDAVQARLAVMSVGALNRYGHPGPSVLTSYARRGTPVLRTDLHGTIVIRTNGSRITVETEEESWELPPARSSP